MQTASVSGLKASLSEYLMLVKTGEEVLLTERGKPIAKIISLRGSESTGDVRMAELERAGLARVGKGCLPDDFWRTPCLRDIKGAALVALISEREEAR